MSEETLSSRPPSLPMPTTIRSWGRPDMPYGTPQRSASSLALTFTVAVTAVSAKSLMSLTTSK